MQTCERKPLSPAQVTHSEKPFAVCYNNVKVRAGDLVAYPCRKGSNMWMSMIRVTEVTSKSVSGYNPADVGQRKINVTSIDRVVKMYVEPESADLAESADDCCGTNLD